jgi:hypothetical protein
VYREPIAAERRYAVILTAESGEQIELGALPGVRVAVTDLLPGA